MHNRVIRTQECLELFGTVCNSLPLSGTLCHYSTHELPTQEAQRVQTVVYKRRSLIEKTKVSYITCNPVLKPTIAKILAKTTAKDSYLKCVSNKLHPKHW